MVENDHFARYGRVVKERLDFTMQRMGDAEKLRLRVRRRAEVLLKTRGQPLNVVPSRDHQRQRHYRRSAQTAAARHSTRCHTRESMGAWDHP